MRIHKQRGAACRTEFMHTFFLSEKVTFYMIFAPVKHHVCTLGVDVKIAILAANRTVAVGDFERFERWHVDFVLDGSTVAIGFVPDLGGIL